MHVLLHVYLYSCSCLYRYCYFVHSYVCILILTFIHVSICLGASGILDEHVLFQHMVCVSAYILPVPKSRNGRFSPQCRALVEPIEDSLDHLLCSQPL